MAPKKVLKRTRSFHLPELGPHPDVDVLHLEPLEILCIKGKAVDWLPGVHTEADLDDFLASKVVYENYITNTKAKKEDFERFKGKWGGLTKIGEIYMEILEKGLLDGSVFERGYRHYEIRHHHCITIEIVGKTVNPATQFNYSTVVIQQQMKNMGIEARHDWSTSRNASETIARLQTNGFPIQPAHLRLRLSVSITWMAALLEKLEGWNPLIKCRGLDVDTRFVDVSRAKRSFKGLGDILAKLDEAVKPLTCSTEFSLEILLDPGYYSSCRSFVTGHCGNLEIVEVVMVPLEIHLR